MFKNIILGFLIGVPSFFSSGNGLNYFSSNDDSKKIILTGIASFYHNKFNGRKTSSGEIFSNKKLTAAHKTLQLGTWVKVTNLKNDSTVLVKVNDRLPKTSTRTIDLSVAAATQLNFIRAGLTKVNIEVIGIPLSEFPSEINHNNQAR